MSSETGGYYPYLKEFPCWDCIIYITCRCQPSSGCYLLEEWARKYLTNSSS